MITHTSQPTRKDNERRRAEFFTRDRNPDPRGRAAYEASVRCFAAAALMSPTVTPVTIPFEGTALNGYLYQPPGGGAQATCIMHGGFDSTAEEWHHIGALAAQQRGYTVLTFDGPGQAGPHYRDGLVFRPNWESVVSPVIDWAIGRPEVDPARIALSGLSMGGGLAPRAAAFGPRIAALICIDRVYDIGRAYTAPLGLGADTERRLTADTDPELDAALARLMHTSSQVRWACRQGMWSFGVRTPRAYLAASLAYNLRGGIAEKITCPVFVGRAESDQSFLRQPEELMQHLTAPATLASFTDAEGAGAHCQVGAQRLLCARMLDWLDETRPDPGPGRIQPAITTPPLAYPYAAVREPAHPPAVTRAWSPMATRTRSRAWCSRLLKAAWLIPAISAASCVESPSTSRSTRAVRSGGGNSARARPSARRSSLFSACRDGSRAAGAGNCSSSGPIATPAGRRDLRSSARLASLTAIRYSQVK